MLSQKKIKITQAARKRDLSKDFDRLSIEATGKNGDELQTLFLVSFDLPRNQLVVDSVIDFMGKQNLLRYAVTARSIAAAEHLTAPSVKTADMIAKLDRYTRLAKRMLHKACLRLESASRNPHQEHTAIRKRVYELPKCLRRFQPDDVQF